MSASSPQQEGEPKSVLVKWLLVVLLALALSVGLAFAGTAKLVERETASGLRYQVLSEGKGASPAATDTVAVHYEGRLLDGTVFDSTYQRGEPAVFKLDQVIPGWTEGLQLMKPGAHYRFVIPPALAYGANGAGGVIPPNATLLFDVELLGVAGAP